MRQTLPQAANGRRPSGPFRAFAIIGPAGRRAGKPGSA